MNSKLLRQISSKHPAGTSSSDDEGIERLDDIMMKYGSLHQQKIDWKEVENLASRYLQKQSKHFRVAVYLITCWLAKRETAYFVDTLELITGLLDKYFENGFPKPGRSGYKVRRKLIVQALLRMNQAATRTPPETVDEIQQRRIKKLLPKLKALLDKHHCDVKLSAVETLLTKTALPAKMPRQDKGSQPQLNMSEGKSQLADLGDERQIKRFLIEFCDLLNDQHPNSPLGYQLRRYALWAGIQSVPPTNDKSESELMPPPSEVLAAYEENIHSGTISRELLQRVEKSVVASPFWITGSLFTVEIALHSDLCRVADTVLSDIKQLLERLPALREICFRGGLPFIDGERYTRVMNLVADQAGQGESVTADQQVQAQQQIAEWTEIQDEIHTISAKDGITGVLEKINSYQATADSLREKYYLSLIASEELHKAGLTNVAEDMLHALEAKVSTLLVNDWEPDYFQRLQYLLNKQSQVEG